MTNQKHILFEQNTHFVILRKEGEVPPILSGDELLELDFAYSSANFNRDGWTLFDWHTKKALVQDRLLKKLIRSKSEGDLNPDVWEVIKFIDKWVRDIHPFKDNLPD